MLFALAFDHRNSLRREFLRLRGEMSPEDVALCRDLKLMVFEALLAAVDRGLPCGDPAILVDEEYGADVIDRSHAAGITLVVPVEVSGRDEFAFEHGDDGFGDAVAVADPTYVKALVRYDPQGSEELNRRQCTRLGCLQAWLADHGRDWMLELLVPPDIDEARRPRTTVQAITELSDAGLRPAFWKLEGMGSTSAYGAVAAATRRSGRADTACLVLGRGADHAAVERWLRLAAPVPDYQGFAVGRTVWWEPLGSYMAGRSSRDEAIRAIAGSYRRLVDIYLEGMNGAP